MALGLTSRLDTRFIMMRSGRSMVLAMVRTTSRASLWVGQSNRLYITSCFWVHKRSSCQGEWREMQCQPQRLSQGPEWRPMTTASAACASGHFMKAQGGRRTQASSHQINDNGSQDFLPTQHWLREHHGEEPHFSGPPRAPPYLVHKQHSGFLRGPLGAEPLCQQFYCMVSCCLLACQVLQWREKQVC